MTQHVYVSGKTPSFYCLITVGEKDVRTIRCVRSQFITEDEALAKAIDTSIASTSIGRYLRKVDAAAAEAQYFATHQPSAMQGGGVAAIMRESMLKEIVARDKELLAVVETNPNVVEQLAESNLLVTEAVPLAGFVNKHKK